MSKPPENDPPIRKHSAEDPGSGEDGQHQERAGEDREGKPDTNRDQLAETISVDDAVRPGAGVHVENYEIIEQIGRGGMGVVYKARQLSLNRIVALKMILAGAHADAQSRRRFMREAEAAASLQHPHIVPVFDMGQSVGQSYFAMEYVDGTDLSSAPKMSPREAAQLLKQVASAIHYAHSQGVIHRDLKPANVLIDQRGTPRVTDFGLAKLVAGEEASQLTGQDQLLGTAPFMPPEQARGDSNQVGPTADVYALGAILYYLLTSQAPFIGKSTYDILRKVQYEDPYAPSRLADKVPRDLETICLKALEKSPERRYATAAAFADDLDLYLSGESISASRASTYSRVVRQVKRHTIATAIGAVIVAMMIWKTWDYVQFGLPTSTYFGNVILRAGAPEGVAKLSTKSKSHRSAVYRITRKGRAGPVLSVIAENSVGHPIDDAELPAFLDAQFSDLISDMPSVARLDFDWESDGSIDQVSAFDAGGQKQWSFTYTQWPTRGRYLGPDGYERSRTGSGASHVEFKYGEDERLREVRFFDRSQRPRANSVGAFGYRFEYEQQPRTTIINCLGPTGQPAIVFGATRFRREYDDQGNELAIHCQDANGQPAMCDGGFTSMTYKYDSYGNMVEYCAWGPDKRPITGSQGEAKGVSVYDDAGFLVEEAYFTPKDDPIAAGEDRVAVRRYKYDARGLVIEESFFDSSGNPTENASGYASIQRDYDTSGRVISERVFDVDAQPCADAVGVWHTTYQYDELGNVTETAQFDDQDQPADNTYGWSRRTSTYERDNLVAEHYYDANGEPAYVAEGYTGYKYKYDDRGNLAETTYVGADGRPVIISTGEATEKLSYDSYGNLITESYFDANGKRTLTGAGWHRAVNHYDEYGNLIRFDLLDMQLQPTMHYEGYSSQVMTVDSRGYSLEVRFLDTKGDPTNLSAGYARVVSEYDNRGNEYDTAYYDANDKPVYVASAGGARVVREHDSFNNVVKETTLDTLGQPTENSDGVATIEATANSRGTIAEERFLDARGDPSKGVARKVIELDSRDRAVEESYFDNEGRPTINALGYAAIRKRYDRFDRVVEETVFDVDDQPTTTIEGAWKTTYAYDDMGNEIETTHYDVDSSLTLNPEGWSRCTSEYDRNRLVAQHYFNTHGQPAFLEEGYAGLLQEYDKRGHVVKITYLGEDDQPVTINTGEAIEKRAIDKFGNTVREAFFDVNEEPTLVSSGWHCAVTHYSDRNQYDGYELFDENLERTRHSSGYSAVAINLDDRGNTVKTLYLGPDNRPTEIDDGYAEVVSKFDGRNNEVETCYLDAEGHPVFVASRDAACIRREFDAHGNVVKKSFYDTSGRLVENSAGIAVIEVDYDERGQQIEQRYFNAVGSRPAGIAREVTKRDARGNALETIYYDANENLVLGDEGYARFVNVYDRLGRRTEFALYDDQGNRARHVQGHSRIVRAFDQHGRMIKEWIYDESDKLVVGDSDYAILEAEYDVFGNRTVEAYFNADGSPRITYGGYHRLVTRYDRGMSAEVSYQDVDGNLVTSTNGYARVAYEYNTQLQLVSGQYFGTSGEPVHQYGLHRFETEYDQRGNKTQIAYYDADANLALREDDGDADYGFGFAIIRSKYDRRGNQTESTVYDADEKPTLRKPHGYWKSQTRFDDRGRVLHRRFFGIDGRPVTIPLGYAEYTNEYDSHGHLVGSRYYDSDGKAVPIVVRISSLSPEAKEAGFQFGDTILRLNGQRISVSDDLNHLLRRAAPQGNTLEVSRRGLTFTYSLPSIDAITFRDSLSEPEVDSEATEAPTSAESPEPIQQDDSPTGA